MSKAFAALLALVASTGLALAQAPAQAPAVEPGTKLSFAPALGGATLTRSASTPVGSTYQYQAANGMQLTVDVYGAGRRVPNGSSHPVIVNQFTDELGAISQQASSAGMKSFEKPSVPSACTYGPYTFRCIVFSAAGTSVTGRISGKFLLIGYREHFVKIIVHWTQTGGQTVAGADKVLNAFVPALMH